MPASSESAVLKNLLAGYPKAAVKKAAGIKALFFDADGVLTDGKIIYSGNGEESKEFHVRDGLIINHLKKAGIVVGIISGRESAAVARRASELKLDFCHQGIEDKLWAVNQLLKHHKLKPRDVAYVGDDLNDLGVFSLVGLSACPADAPPYVKSKADVVTSVKGGRGVVREVADLLLAAQGKLAGLITSSSKKS